MQRDKVGSSFAILQAKARLFADQLAYDPTASHASPGWVSNVLKRHEFVHVNLKGEAAEYNTEDRLKLMADFRAELLKL